LPASFHVSLLISRSSENLRLILWPVMLSRNHAKLTKHTCDVCDVPRLHDLSACNAVDIDVNDGRALASCRRTHQRSRVCAGSIAVDGDGISLSNHGVDGNLQVGEATA